MLHVDPSLLKGTGQLGTLCCRPERGRRHTLPRTSWKKTGADCFHVNSTGVPLLHSAIRSRDSLHHCRLIRLPHVVLETVRWLCPSLEAFFLLNTRLCTHVSVHSSTDLTQFCFSFHTDNHVEEDDNHYIPLHLSATCIWCEWM